MIFFFFRNLFFSHCTIFLSPSPTTTLRCSKVVLNAHQTESFSGVYVKVTFTSENWARCDNPTCAPIVNAAFKRIGWETTRISCSGKNLNVSVGFRIQSSTEMHYYAFVVYPLANQKNDIVFVMNENYVVNCLCTLENCNCATHSSEQKNWIYMWSPWCDMWQNMWKLNPTKRSHEFAQYTPWVVTERCTTKSNDKTVACADLKSYLWLKDMIVEFHVGEGLCLG